MVDSDNMFSYARFLFAVYFQQQPDAVFVASFIDHSSSSRRKARVFLSTSQHSLPIVLLYSKYQSQLTKELMDYSLSYNPNWISCCLTVSSVLVQETGPTQNLGQCFHIYLYYRHTIIVVFIPGKIVPE